MKLKKLGLGTGIVLILLIIGFIGINKSRHNEKKTQLIIGAAASLKDVMMQIETIYEKTHPEVDLVFTYGGSGTLQAQIEQGAPMDVFLSAAVKQVEVLDEKGLIAKDGITPLLENDLVLIVPEEGAIPVTEFKECDKEEIKRIAIGDPSSVPAGKYAEEVFKTIGIEEKVFEKAALATDVRQVLTWVQSGVVDCGVVYATDAKGAENIKTVAYANDFLKTPIIYPVALLERCKEKEKAETFIRFLQEEKARDIFVTYGFKMK